MTELLLTNSEAAARKHRDARNEQGPPATGGISLRDSIGWSLVGNIAYSGSQWAAVALLAKLGSPEMVGQFGLGLAVTAPICTLASLQLRAIVATDSKHTFATGDYIALRLTTTTVALAMTLLAAFAYEGIVRMVILVVAVAKSIEWLSDILYGFLQRRDRLDSVARSMIAKGILACISAGFLCWIHASALSVGTALCIAWLPVLLLYDVPAAAGVLCAEQRADHTAPPKEPPWRVLMPRWSAARQKDLLRTSFPLGLSMVLISLTANVPRYYLQHFRGEAEVGIFTALVYFGMAGHQLVMAMGAAGSPRMARYYAGKRRPQFLSVFRKLLAGAAILAVAGVLCAHLTGTWILRICYRSEYSQYSRILVWVMVAAGIGYLVAVLGYTATARWRFKAQPLALCAVIGVLVLACRLLIPQYGVMGAVLASLAAQVTGLVSYGLVVFLPDSKQVQH